MPRVGNLLAALTGSPSLLAEIAASGARAMRAGWEGRFSCGLARGNWARDTGLPARFGTSRALTASLLCLIEPVLNPIWVALGVGEIPSSGAMLGERWCCVRGIFDARAGRSPQWQDSSRRFPLNGALSAAGRF
jgi:hypothetical protein